MNEKVDYVHKLERVCQLNRPEPPDNRGYQPPLGGIHLSSDYWLSNRPNLSMVSMCHSLRGDMTWVLGTLAGVSRSKTLVSERSIGVTDY